MSIFHVGEAGTELVYIVDPQTRYKCYVPTPPRRKRPRTARWLFDVAKDGWANAGLTPHLKRPLRTLSSPNEIEREYYPLLEAAG